MSDTRFRYLLILYVISTLAAISAAFVPGGYSQELANAYAREPEPWFFGSTWVALVVALSLLATILVGLIGLFFFRRWGRAVSLYSTVAGLCLYLFSGPEVYSALESVLFDVSSLLWGAIIALSYSSPIADRLRSNSSSKSNPLRGLD